MKLLVVRAIYRLKAWFEDPVALFQALGVAQEDTILEVGCAIGYHTLALARVASRGKVYALDIWEQGLAHLRRRAGPDARIETVCGSADEVELPPASLDKVVCFDTLHEVPNPEGAVTRWVTCLRQGGILLYRDPEIEPERIAALSGGQLRPFQVLEGVHLFVRQ